jgi:hypothetical protein
MSPIESSLPFCLGSANLLNLNPSFLIMTWYLLHSSNSWLYPSVKSIVWVYAERWDQKYFLLLLPARHSNSLGQWCRRTLNNDWLRIWVNTSPLIPKWWKTEYFRHWYLRLDLLLGHHLEAWSSTPNRCCYSHPRSKCTGTAAVYWCLQCCPIPMALALHSLYKRRSVIVILSQQRLLFYKELIILLFFNKSALFFFIIWWQIMWITVLAKLRRKLQGGMRAWVLAKHCGCPHMVYGNDVFT